MLDPLKEELISLTDAAKLIPKRRGGKRCNVSTLYRWCAGGVRGIVLESVQIGGTRCTSKEALQRFFLQLGEDCGIRRAVRPCKLRERRQREANRYLDENGI